MLTFVLVVLGALLIIASSVDILLGGVMERVGSHIGGGEPEPRTGISLVVYRIRFLIAVGLAGIVAVIAITVLGIVEALQGRFSKK
jgi:hypothetical protein